MHAGLSHVARRQKGVVSRTQSRRPLWQGGETGWLYFKASQGGGRGGGAGRTGWPLGVPMRRIFWFRRRGPRPGHSSTRPWAACLGFGWAGGESQAGPGYLTAYCAVGQLHRAASVGAVATVDRFLTFRVNGVNDPDKRNR